MSPSPLSPSSRLRSTVFVSLLLVALCCLFGRIVHLQVLRHEELADKSERQHRTEGQVVPERGTIYTADLQPLAVPVPSFDLAVDPQAAGLRLDLLLDQVAPILGVTASALRTELAPHRDKSYRRLARDLSNEQLRGLHALEDKRGRLPRGLMLDKRMGRVYPQGSLAAALIGFCTWEGKGGSGLELAFDSLLAGQPGRLKLTRDARQVFLRAADDDWIYRPQPGADVVLTLQLPVQFAAELALDEIAARYTPKSAIALVLDVDTGDVLAMASRPTFDPNRYSESEQEAWNIRSVTDVFEPGSTFKSFILATALDQGTVNMDTTFDCEHGRWTVYRRTLSDVHPMDVMSVLDILVESSNIGAAKVALSLAQSREERPPPEETAKAKEVIADYLTRVFGFGRKTGIGIPGELAGRVKPGRSWGQQTLTSIPMGYEIMVTPIQLAVGYATLASGGVHRAPRLVREVRVPAGSAVQVPPGLSDVRPAQRVIDTMDDPLRDLRHALAAVCERGTAKHLPKLSGGYGMGGKTGTTHKVDPATGQYVKKYISSFVGIAPIEDPRFVCLIIVDDPQGAKFGGAVAAPGVRDILEATLQALPPTPRASSEPRAQVEREAPGGR